MSSLLIRNGLVVNATGSAVSDVLVREGKVAALGENLRPEHEAEVIDARGAHVMPGGVDPHVHLSPFLDDFDSGSKAALAGGITTIGVMSFADAGEPFGAMLARHVHEAERHSLVDVVLHGAVNVEAAPRAEVLTDIFATGQTTFKIFTMLGSFDGEYPRYIDLLHRAREHNLLAMFHCEDHAVMQEAARALKAQRQEDLTHYESSRPVLSEELSVQKVIALCELTRCPVYIVHVSSARALAACEIARRRGLPVSVETRPIYLHFDAGKYAAADGPLFVSFPPIRSRTDGDALWQGLADGTVHTVGSDHAPLSREQKLTPERCCVGNPRPGMSNLQEMLPLLYSEGVSTGRLTPERFVQVTSANAAKLLHLYPQKGAVAVGADADIAIWDPNIRTTFHAADGYSRADFSLYDRWSLKGGLRMTIRQGVIAYSSGRVQADIAKGRVLRREPKPC